MFNRIINIPAIGMALCLAFHPQLASAEIFKSSEFLTWKPESQSFYIDSSVGMASLVAAQNDKVQAKCIDDWYIADEAASIRYITDVMRKYPDHHPRGVILAAIEKKCGSMTY
jgi:hypothetical protein